MSNLISVIIPCKNGENYLKEAISSIKTQNMNIEIIVVNDGSTDETENIAKDLGCFVFNHEISKGQIAAKNTALKVANGDYIIFCDHDDLLTSNALQKMISEFQKDTTLEVVSAKIQDFLSLDAKNQNQKIKAEPYWGCLGGSIMFKKQVFDKIGLFNENISAGEIIWLNQKFIELNIKVKKIDFVSGRRRIHDTNYGKTNRGKEFKDYATLLRTRLKK